jgi:hypothetical protein
MAVKPSQAVTSKGEAAMHRSNTTGIGMRKHRQAFGQSPKSPRFMHWMKREAEKIIRRRRGIIEPASSVSELMNKWRKT